MKSNGKILGVCGGMGPAASAEFMRLLAAMAPAKTDQDHPVVYLYSNPQIPDRTEAILRAFATATATRILQRRRWASTPYGWQESWRYWTEL